MGTCIKCGRETLNSYVYYTADLRSKSFEKWVGAGRITTTYSQYSNFKRCEAHACTRCIAIAELFDFDVLKAVSGLIITFVIFVVMLTGYIHGTIPFNGWIGIFFLISAVFGVGGVFLLIGVGIAEYRNCKMDKYRNKDGGQEALMKILAEKEKSEKIYLTAAKFKELQSKQSDPMAEIFLDKP